MNQLLMIESFKALIAKLSSHVSALSLTPQEHSLAANDVQIYFDDLSEVKLIQLLSRNYLLFSLELAQSLTRSIESGEALAPYIITRSIIEYTSFNAWLIEPVGGLPGSQERLRRLFYLRLENIKEASKINFDKAEIIQATANHKQKLTQTMKRMGVIPLKKKEDNIYATDLAKKIGMDNHYRMFSGFVHGRSDLLEEYGLRVIELKDTMVVKQVEQNKDLATTCLITAVRCLSGMYQRFNAYMGFEYSREIQDLVSLFVVPTTHVPDR